MTQGNTMLVKARFEDNKYTSNWLSCINWSGCRAKREEEDDLQNVGQRPLKI